MTLQIGDRVRLVAVPDRWKSEWGIVGNEAAVTYVGAHSVEVNTGWWWDMENIELVDAPHTDADLAMALMLAEMLRHNADMPEDCENCFDDYGKDEVSDWLRTEVIRELRERGGAQ